MTWPIGDLGSAVICALGSPNAITVNRYPVGSYSQVTGLWEGGIVSSFTLDAFVRPSGPKDIEVLAENERTSEAITVIVTQELETGDSESLDEGDQVVWKGRTYRVSTVTDWLTQANYLRAVCVRVKE